MIVNYGTRLIEIQVRTALQHLWAELSEKLSDVVDRALKYGGGDEETIVLLASASDAIMGFETIGEALLKNQGVYLQLVRATSEADLHNLPVPVVDSKSDLPDDVRQRMMKLDHDLLKANEMTSVQRGRIVDLLTQMGEVLPQLKGRKDAISD